MTSEEEATTTVEVAMAAETVVEATAVAEAMAAETTMVVVSWAVQLLNKTE